MSDIILTIAVKVVPGASRDEVVGWLGEALKIKVAAPPEKGKANKSVCRVLAKNLGISEAQLQIVGGLLSPNKTLEVRGLSPGDLMERLPNK